MKRGTKIWLIVALIFGLIGGGLCLSAAILGVDYQNVRAMVDDGDFTWRIGRFDGLIQIATKCRSIIPGGIAWMWKERIKSLCLSRSNC